MMVFVLDNKYYNWTEFDLRFAFILIYHQLVEKTDIVQVLLIIGSYLYLPKVYHFVPNRTAINK